MREGRARGLNRLLLHELVARRDPGSFRDVREVSRTTFEASQMDEASVQAVPTHLEPATHVQSSALSLQCYVVTELITSA